MSTYRMHTILTENDIRRLKVKDVLYITGVVVTARDQAHKRALEFQKDKKKLPFELEGNVIYHCGPVMRRQPNGNWVVVSAGPTTSTRLEKYEAEFLRAFKPRIIVGKGGMGQKTMKSLVSFGAAYCTFTGGAAVLAAEAISRVRDVAWLDLGMPEAMWLLEVKDFGPLVVAIDSYGRNLYSEIERKAQVNKQDIFQRMEL